MPKSEDWIAERSNEMVEVLEKAAERCEEAGARLIRAKNRIKGARITLVVEPQMYRFGCDIMAVINQIKNDLFGELNKLGSEIYEITHKEE